MEFCNRPHTSLELMMWTKPTGFGLESGPEAWRALLELEDSESDDAGNLLCGGVASEFTCGGMAGEFTFDGMAGDLLCRCGVGSRELMGPASGVGLRI